MTGKNSSGDDTPTPSRAPILATLIAELQTFADESVVERGTLPPAPNLREQARPHEARLSPDLEPDQLTRVSALVGVYKGLHLLFADETADEWARRPNCGPLFDRETPIQAMIEGGTPRMLEVRRYIDAVRGGL